MKKIIAQFVISITIALVAGGNFVLAQGIKNSGSELDKVAVKSGTKDNADLGSISGTVINAALQLVGLIFMLLLVYAGVLWMTARGEEGQIEKAQKIITASIIGLIITISAYAVTVFVTGRFEGP